MYCIFCGIKTNREPREHIVPEGLVGHRPFEIKFGSIIADPKRLLILENGEVCGKCNNRLGSLDHYLQQQFGFLRTYWNPIGTKSGKTATVHRPGMYAERRADGPHITLNMEDHTVKLPNGVHINPADSQELSVRVKDFEINNRIANITFQQPIRINKRFMRALHKIAFELLCFCNGPQFVLESMFDPIRHYILQGRGNREMLLTQSFDAGTWEQPLFNLKHDPTWPGWLGIIRLASTFFIDLSPENVFFSKATHTALTANNLILYSDKDGGKPIER